MMKTGLKLLLLSAVTLLVSAQSRNYQDLSEQKKTHIDKALKEVNEKFTGSHHVAYEQILDTKFRGSDYYVNVRLMVTTCTKDKTKGYGHREECVTQKLKTPIFDCVVCNTPGRELIDCARVMDIKNSVSPTGSLVEKDCDGSAA
ncbi:cystatin-like protein isoform X1 [Hoplias malabaricus]|uniref:cystatin-like protein isoform X1 n=1 Tax=Hoplias malabaricus TaxID=27720 RepID=UPI003462E746